MDITPFETHTLSENIRNRLDSLLTFNTKTLLKVAFKHNGYVAGGFASALAGSEFLRDKNSTIRHCFNLNTSHARNDLNMEHYRTVCSRGGFNPIAMELCDIDVWFPTNHDLGNFFLDPTIQSLIVSDDCYSYTTSSGIATEFVLDKRQRVQVINGFLHERDEQVSRFDIYNAMVSFDDKNIRFPKHWRELEENSTLHVSCWNDWTINRVKKYLNRKGYTSLTGQSSDDIKTGIMHAIELMQNNMLEGAQTDRTAENGFVRLIKPYANNDDVVMPSVVRHMLKTVPNCAFKTMSPMSLLELSTISGNGSDGYIAMHTDILRHLSERSFSQDVK